MTFEAVTRGIQQTNPLVLQGRNMAMEEVARRQNLQRYDQQQFLQALMGMAGYMRQREQDQAAATQQDVVNNREDARLAMDLANAAAQRGLTDAQTKTMLDTLGLKTDLLGAQVESVQAGTKGEQQRQAFGAQMQPGALDRQQTEVEGMKQGIQQAGDMFPTQLDMAQEQLGAAQAQAPYVGEQAAANVAATQAGTALKEAQTKILWAEADAMGNPLPPEAEKWQKGIQEEFTGIQSNLNSSLQQISATLANQDVVKMMMTTDAGKEAVSEMVARQLKIMQQMEDMASLGRDLSKQTFATENEAWSYFGDARGRILGGEAPAQAGGGVDPAGVSFTRSAKQ